MNRLLKTIENGTKTTEYRYDNAGNRFIKKTDKELTVYLRHGQIAVAMDIEVKYDSTSDYGSINRYVLSGDLLAGKITKTIKLDNSIVTKKEWYHLDHLNSTKATTDEAGKMSTMYEYRAFGEELKKLGSGDAKYKFQGKELDEETNLMYFNARYYDQTIGRFINVDPIQSGENWYVAFGNNPLNKVDPTGLEDNKPPHPGAHPDWRNTPKTIAPLIQTENQTKYGIECMKFSIANEVFETGARVKGGYDREKIMGLLKDSPYSSDGIQSTLNNVLYDKKISLTSLTGDETRSVINNNSLGNDKLVTQFRQSDYWGNNKENSYHWVGFKGINTDSTNDIKTKDSWFGRIFTNKGSVDTINRGTKIEILDK